MTIKEKEEFYSLFDSFPNTALYHINDGCEDLNKLLEELAHTIGGELTTQEFSEIEQKKFRLKDRNFEYAVVSNCLDKVDLIDRFIASIYHSLENSAFTIILQEKGSMDISEMIDILDRNHFRAVNDINIFEKYHLVMGKKLHMWGAGQ